MFENKNKINLAVLGKLLRDLSVNILGIYTRIFPCSWKIVCRNIEEMCSALYRQNVFKISIIP